MLMQADLEATVEPVADFPFYVAFEEVREVALRRVFKFR